MKKKSIAVAIVLLCAAGAAFAYRRQGIDQAAEFEAPPTDPTWWDGVTENISFDTWIQDNQSETDQKVADMTAIIDTSANVRAFLETIARAEGTSGQADPYRVCYGYRHTIQSFADHPAITGEWMGEKLPDAICIAAGVPVGSVSTAAGKYQIKKATWKTLKSRLGLRDFSPESQDAAAIELINEKGVLDAVKAGDITTALDAVRKIWASLPGAGYKQPERSLAWVQSQFTNAGGVLA